MTQHHPTAEPSEPASLPPDRGRWSVSAMNWAFIAIFGVSAVILVFQGRWWGSVLTPLILALGWWWAARTARWRDSTDKERVLSFEPADEREEAIARNGWATTGKLAVLFLVAQSILVFHVMPQLWLYPVGTLGLFAVVWYIATSRAVRRA